MSEEEQSPKVKMFAIAFLVAAGLVLSFVVVFIIIGVFFMASAAPLPKIDPLPQRKNSRTETIEKERRDRRLPDSTEKRTK